MKKLGRFALLAFFYVAMVISFYCVIPSITWLFGGSFLEVAQHPLHVLFIGFTTIIMVGVVFNECFDSDFYSKD